MPRNARLGLLLGLALAGSAGAGESHSLADKALRGALAVEVQLVFPKGQRLDRARDQALAQATMRVLAPEGEEPPKLERAPYVLGSASACWKKARARGKLSALVFFLREEGKALTPLVGVEQETGRYTDLNPHYAQLVEAVREASGWQDERMHAVPAPMLWERQRQALRESKNPYLVHLAVRFLEEHQGADVVAEVWGAKGTAERAKAEQRAAGPENDTPCR